MASLFVGHATQKSKLHNLQYDEGGNHMAETERNSIVVYNMPVMDTETLRKFPEANILK